MLLLLLRKDVQERHNYCLLNPANGMKSLNNVIVINGRRLEKGIFLDEV